MKKISMLLAAVALSAACGIPVSDECKAAADLTEDDCVGSDAYDAEQFAAGGTCWTNADTAKACTDSCKAFTDACDTAGGGDAGN